MTNYKTKLTAILKCASSATLSLASLAVLCAASAKSADSTKEKLTKGGLMLTAAIATSASSLALNEFIEEAKEEFN